MLPNTFSPDIAGTKRSGGRLSMLIALFLLSACNTQRYTDSDNLHVFLQGHSSAEIAALVNELGGNVTHTFSSINAVGAKVTGKQLDQALRTQLISFHIDDLAAEKAPEEVDEFAKENCKVRGQIELDIRENGFYWPLYNKKKEAVHWESLTIEWPHKLGTITSLKLDGTEIDSTWVGHAHGQATVTFPAKTKVRLEKRAELEATFANALPLNALPRQSDYKIAASFAEGCTDKLVPGYINNHEDFYYNTAAGADTLHLQGITGKGVTVAVIDSGLWEHPNLMRDSQGNSRVLARYDAITNTLDQEALDESGHGSHMSSIIAHSGPALKNSEHTGSYKGVAPDARLVAIKVLDREGRAHLLDIAHAIQWVIENKTRYNIRVLNISLGQVPRWPYWEDPVAQLAMAAWAEGIAVVAAAGNEGPELATIGSPGNTPHIITVGAVTDSWTLDTRDDDYIPDFSSRGPTPSGHIKPDIVALGGHMTGLTHPDSDLATSDPENLLPSGELVSTGSSQAAALVSGIIALMLELEPELTNEQIKCKLVTSAEPAINRNGQLAYSPFTQGAGYITAPRTITLGQRNCMNDMDLAANRRGEGAIYGPTIADEDDNPTLPGLSDLVAAEKSENSPSDTRKWGVKAHVERLTPEALQEANEGDRNSHWVEMYLEEKAAIERLTLPPKT